jgi:hypothetical protein
VGRDNRGLNMEKENMINKAYGHFRVIEYAGRNKSNGKQWKCECGCGNIKIVAENKLKSGHTRSCGCLKYIEIIKRWGQAIGRKYGRLLIYSIDIKNKKIYAECKCSCGKHSKPRLESVVSGRVVSCGCAQRESASVRGEKHWNYKNGKSKGKNGYVVLNGAGRKRDGRQYEHRMVMEEIIGRKLDRKEVVHHIDRNRTNNSPDNLMLFANDTEHHKYHREAV